MKKVILAAVALTLTGAATAQTVHVREHTTRDGVYVPEHDRTAPNQTKLDNWSTRGNTNPETGKPGTVDPYSTSRPKPRY